MKVKFMVQYADEINRIIQSAEVPHALKGIPDLLSKYPANGSDDAIQSFFARLKADLARYPGKDREEVYGALAGVVHTHHWIIEFPHGPYSNGVCKICGDDRIFSNSAPVHPWEERRM